MLVLAADCPLTGALVSAVSLAVAAPFSLLPEPACDAAEPAEPLVSTWVAAADVPVAGALVRAVSLAVPAPFSELPEPAWEAAEPAEPLVSTLVAAGEEPVCWLPAEVEVSFAVAAAFALVPE